MKVLLSVSLLIFYFTANSQELNIAYFNQDVLYQNPEFKRIYNLYINSSSFDIKSEKIDSILSKKQLNQKDFMMLENFDSITSEYLIKSNTIFPNVIRENILNVIKQFSEEEQFDIIFAIETDILIGNYEELLSESLDITEKLAEYSSERLNYNSILNNLISQRQILLREFKEELSLL